MKFVRSILAALFLASLSTGAHAQAIQIPPAKACFQATAGLSGMVGILGTVTPGSGGTSGTYVAPLTGGSGTGATASITVSGGAVTAVVIQTPGSAYQVGDVLSAAASTIGNVTGFSVPVTTTATNTGLAGGTVGFYIPNTLTAKQTWQNAGQTVLNTNPVTLDQNGCALIYGSGTYRQIVKDSSGNTVWDQPTTGAATIPGGISGGSPNAQTLSVGFSGLDGSTVSFIAGYTNTGSMTLAPAGSSPIPVQKDTSAGPVPLTGGEVVAGNQVTLTYSATGGFFHLSAYPATASAVSGRTAVRQTVTSGPANSNGTPSFLAASSATLVPTMQNISTTTPLVASAAGGVTGSAPVDYVYQYTSNPTVPACAVNAACYIYENAQTGVFTTSTLVPIYQCGGAISSAPGQFSFDYCGGGTGVSGTNFGQPMVGYLGNGTNAVVTAILAIGECTASASTLSGCIAYAYNGYYDSGYTATLPSTGAAVGPYNHNIGVPSATALIQIMCTSADNGFSVGDVVVPFTDAGANLAPFTPWVQRNTGGYNTGTTQSYEIISRATNSYAAATLSKWSYKMIFRRGWGGA